MRIVDLSRELYHRTPSYPGQPPIIHGVWKTHEEAFVDSGSVHGNAVTSLELSLLLAGSAEGLYEFALFIELQHIIRPVAVGDENRTIGRDGDGARLESIRVFVDPGLFRKVNRPLLSAIEPELDDLVIGMARTVKVFHAVPQPSKKYSG